VLWTFTVYREIVGSLLHFGCLYTTGRVLSWQWSTDSGTPLKWRWGRFEGGFTAKNGQFGAHAQLYERHWYGKPTLRQPENIIKRLTPLRDGTLFLFVWCLYSQCDAQAQGCGQKSCAEAGGCNPSHNWELGSHECATTNGKRKAGARGPLRRFKRGNRDGC
jgi:hypothetical protein